VATALRGGTGVAIRKSGTMNQEFLYVAAPCRGGAVRLAVPLEEVTERVYGIRQGMLWAIVAAFVPAFAVAFFFARSMSSDIGGRLGESSANLDRLVRQLELEREALQNQEQVRKDFVMNVSHELRTPLAAIQGYAETLLDGALADPNHNERFLRIISRNAERLANLAADLLSLSGVENGTREFQPEALHINTLLLDAAESIRPTADRRAIKVLIDAAPDQAWAFADPGAVHQVLANLLDNAVKYSSEGGTVTLGARTGPAAMVEVSVRDHGIGIPEQDLPRLFERFFRVDRARSRELGGTGLGLAIVKHLVRAQGGDVAVESQVGKGSTFRFTLPSAGVAAPVTAA
jgi:two-component system phosphate regulon sensor histidine kinase PhoR